MTAVLIFFGSVSHQDWLGTLAVTPFRLMAPSPQGYPMLFWSISFLIIAIVAALFGFGGIAAGATSIAKVLFFIFIVLFVISMVASLFSRRRER